MNFILSCIILGILIVFALFTIQYKPKLFYISKSLPVIFSLIVMISNFSSSNMTVFFIIGICFCIAGDIFLLFEKGFIFGIGAFLIGFSVYGFALLNNSHQTIPIILIIIISLISFIYGLFITKKVQKTSFSKLLIPIWIYVIIISLLLISGFNYNLSGYKIFPFIASGTAFLYISDCMLAYEKFISKFNNSQILIHLLYYIGQGFIVFGLCFFN